MAQSLEVPPARGCHESVVVEDKMFVWGGGNSDRGPYHSRLDLFSVNMLTGEWSSHKAHVRSPETPPPCYRAAATCIGNTIYAHGGMMYTPSLKIVDGFYKLMVEEMRWRRVITRETKPGSREGAAMCSVDGKLLLMGGYTGTGYSNELFEFDPQTSCWFPVCVTGSQPSPLVGHTLTAVDEKTAVLFGGFDGNKSLNDLWLLDVKRKVWSHITPTSPLWPQPRTRHTACTMVCEDGEIKVLLLGGQGDGGKVLSDCWMLDVLTGRGEKLTLDGEAIGRVGHSAGCVMLSDGTIAISAFGGCTSVDTSSVVSNPLFYQWNPHHPSVLCSGRPSAGAVFHACPPSFAVQPSEELRQLREEFQSLTASNKQLQSQPTHTEQQKDEQLAQERCLQL